MPLGQAATTTMHQVVPHKVHEGHSKAQPSPTVGQPSEATYTRYSRPQKASTGHSLDQALNVPSADTPSDKSQNS